jgi:uncharacterized cupredoxin-like copper-binding protein
VRIIAAALLAAVLVVAACSGGGSPSPTVTATSSPPATVTATPAASAAPSAAATRIEVQLTDSLRIEPAAMTVPAGVPVTFVITNAGAIEHEFYLGDAAAQAEHEQEMLDMGGMAHDDPDGIAVEPGETREFTYTFAEPGETLAGCHVAGHYGGGMKATITVTG